MIILPIPFFDLYLLEFASTYFSTTARDVMIIVERVKSETLYHHYLFFSGMATRSSLDWFELTVSR